MNEYHDLGEPRELLALMKVRASLSATMGSKSKSARWACLTLRTVVSIASRASFGGSYIFWTFSWCGWALISGNRMASGWPCKPTQSYSWLKQALMCEFSAPSLVHCSVLAPEARDMGFKYIRAYQIYFTVLLAPSVPVRQAPER